MTDQQPAPMSVWPEAWVVAADRRGLWLIDGEQPWTPDYPVPAGGDPDDEIDRLLEVRGAMKNMIVTQQHVHRVDERGLALVHLVAVRAAVLVDAEWPDAVPVSLDMDPDLLAALHHIGWLIANDPDFAALFHRAGVLEVWRRHLSGLVADLTRQQPLAA